MFWLTKRYLVIGEIFGLTEICLTKRNFGLQKYFGFQRDIQVI